MLSKKVFTFLKVIRKKLRSDMADYLTAMDTLRSTRVSWMNMVTVDPWLVSDTSFTRFLLHVL